MFVKTVTKIISWGCTALVAATGAFFGVLFAADAVYIRVIDNIDPVVLEWITR